MPESESVYHRFILEHNRAPRHYGCPAHHDARVRVYNPLCGDEMEVFLSWRPPGVVGRVDFAGESCAIATASASLLTQAVETLDRERARELCRRFLAALADPAAATDLPAALAPLLEVRRFPGRLDCARLAWRALAKILDGCDTSRP